MILLAILSGFLIAPLAPLLNRWLGRAAGYLLALLPLALTVYFLSLVDPVVASGPVRFERAWAPSLGVNLSFVVDGLSLLMALLVCGVGTLIVIYGTGYLAGHPQLGRFHLLILTFMASMLGLVMSDNLLTLFVFWELTSITSFLLIGFKHGSLSSRTAALQALLVTGLGGLALLAGFILLGAAGGSYEISQLVEGADAIGEHALYLPILILVLLGAFTKSAQTPFHFWLPGAMAAPTPVSAYLHSATMVKAGIYLLARLSPLLGGSPAWLILVAGVGGVTAVLGAFLAWQKEDLKQILAYSTIGVLGLLVCLIGLGTPLAIEAAMTFLLVHALYKGALFLVAGAVDHETGTREIGRLGGLGRVMPLTAIAAGLAALSMAGLPPFLGFIGKELVYEATRDVPTWPLVFTGLAVVANGLMVAAAGLVAIKPFFGPRGDTPETPHRVPLSLWLGPLALAGLGLLFGLRPGLVGGSLLSAASTAVLGKPVTLKLALWHGLTPELALSALTLGIGAAVYWRRGRLLPAAARLDGGRFGPQRGYQAGLSGLDALARAVTSRLQSGYLRNYLLLVISTTVALVALTIVTRPVGRLASELPPLDIFLLEETAITAIIVISALVAVTADRRLAAVTGLGGVGFGVALLYIVYSAPDLAMTQFAIETLTVVLFVLVIYRLPRFVDYASKRERTRDAVIAIASGGLMTLLTLLVVNAAQIGRSLEGTAASYFIANSLEKGKGTNVVNVILVDFRGLDTLGEATVLVVAAAGVFALLKFRQRIK